MDFPLVSPRNIRDEERPDLPVEFPRVADFSCFDIERRVVSNVRGFE